MSNEQLSELGPYAYILFTGLWMIADREGRFEWRPKRIKAVVMPLWEEMPTEAVENLLEKLSESGLIHRYEVDGKTYGLVQQWQRHQKCHPREECSIIPPPIDERPNVRDFNAQKAQPRRVQGSALAVSSPPFPSFPSSPSFSGGGNTTTSIEEKSPPEPPPPQTKKPTPERKPPGSARRSRASDSASVNEKAPEEVSLLRESLDKLAREIRMPPPDDAMLHRIYDAGHGATALEIHETLVLLWRRHKFRDMRSWGFVPVVLDDVFGRERTVSASA